MTVKPLTIDKKGKKIGLINIPLVTDPQEIRSAILETTMHCVDQIREALREKGIERDKEINLQYALRSGNLIYEEGAELLTTKLNSEGFSVTHSVIGVSGTNIYAAPEVQNYKENTVTIVMDTSAGNPDTLITVGEWYREKGLPCHVTALTTTDVARTSIKKSNVSFLEAAGIIIPSTTAQDLDVQFPGTKLRLFCQNSNPKGRMCLIGDLGDTMFRKHYHDTDEVKADADRIVLLTPKQKQDFINHFSLRIHDEAHNPLK